MKEELRKYQILVDHEIENLAKKLNNSRENFIAKNYEMLSEYLLRGGKRLRAIVCLKTYEAFGGKQLDKIMLPAISCELFHASSLIHDDIMDEDDKRRNKPSMHKLDQQYFLEKFDERLYDGKIFGKDSLRFAVSSGIIQGNILFSLGLKCLTDCEFEDRLKILAFDLVQSSYREVNDGQLLDLVNEFDQKISEEDYIKMSALKTGVLFATSFELGAIFADVEEKNRKLISDFGMNIAIAFQIQDDIMDVSENMKKGNTFGSDIIKGKQTLLMINALKNSNPEDKKYLMRVCGKMDATSEEITKAVDIFHSTGSINRAKELAEQYINKGVDCLDKLRDELTEEGYTFFANLARYMVDRIV